MRPRRGLRKALLHAAGAFFAMVLTPSVVAVQDVAALTAAPTDPALRWRAHLVAAAPSPMAADGALDAFDPGRTGYGAAPGAAAGLGFRLSLAPPDMPDEDVAAAKGDRLALAAGARVVFAAPDGATPATSLAANTPADHDPPTLTAALPVAFGGSSGLGLAAAGGALAALAAALVPPQTRARAEACMATAVYFEARGEPLRGQYAVAQVVMNRVRSGAYPSDVCGVVYQNAAWRDHCQFSFACDGRRERVREPEAWAVAEKVARDVIEHGVYLPDVGTATNYHATYVRPRWASAMVEEEKLGRHIFYSDPSLGDDPAVPLAFSGD